MHGTACKTPIVKVDLGFFRFFFKYHGDKKRSVKRRACRSKEPRRVVKARNVGYLYLIGKKISLLRDDQRVVVRLYERVGGTAWVSRIPGYTRHDRTGSSALCLETVQRTLHEESTTSIVVELVRAHVKDCETRWFVTRRKQFVILRYVKHRILCV